MGYENTNSLEQTTETAETTETTEKTGGSIMKPLELKELAIKNAMRFMESQGFETDAWEQDGLHFVAKGDDELRFVHVSVGDSSSGGFESLSDRFVPSSLAREKYENSAVQYLVKSGDVEKAVFFDEIAILVMPENKALLRRETNILGTKN